MTQERHGKIPEWYNKDSEHYDTFNEDTDNSRTTNSTIEKLLKKHKVKSVLDLTCGTGSQLFWLAKRGYEVVGSDISPGMLKAAEKRAEKEKTPLKLILGDVRTVKVGEFDAALTIFNAVGHLTRTGFEKAMRNIHRNLNEGGLYLFDIFNLSYLTSGDNITKLSIEWVRTAGDTKLREVQHSIIDSKGVLISYTMAYKKKGVGKLKMSKSVGTLQLYTARELREMLARNGFAVLQQCEMEGSKLSETKSERILTLAKKV